MDMDGLSTAAGLKSITEIQTLDTASFIQFSQLIFRFSIISWNSAKLLWNLDNFHCGLSNGCGIALLTWCSCQTIYKMAPQFFGSPFKTFMRLCPRLDSEVKLGPVKPTRSTLDDPIESCESCDSHRRTVAPHLGSWVSAESHDDDSQWRNACPPAVGSNWRESFHETWKAYVTMVAICSNGGSHGSPKLHMLDAHPMEAFDGSTAEPATARARVPRHWHNLSGCETTNVFSLRLETVLACCAWTSSVINKSGLQTKNIWTLEIGILNIAEYCQHWCARWTLVIQVDTSSTVYNHIIDIDRHSDIDRHITYMI